MSKECPRLKLVISPCFQRRYFKRNAHLDIGNSRLDIGHFKAPNTEATPVPLPTLPWGGMPKYVLKVLVRRGGTP